MQHSNEIFQQCLCRNQHSFKNMKLCMFLPVYAAWCILSRKKKTKKEKTKTAFCIKALTGINWHDSPLAVVSHVLYRRLDCCLPTQSLWKGLLLCYQVDLLPLLFNTSLFCVLLIMQEDLQYSHCAFYAASVGRRKFPRNTSFAL